MNDEDKSQDELLEDLKALRQQIQKQQSSQDEQSRLYQLYSELTTDYVFSVGFDNAGKHFYTMFNRDAFQRVTGYDPDELADPNDIYHPEDKPRADAERALSFQGIPTEGEYRILTKSGELRWLAVKRHPEWNEDHSKVLFLHGLVKDVTERRRAEEERRRSDERYRVLAENSSDMIWVLNTEGKFLYFSPAIESFLGFTAEEAMAISITDLVAPESLIAANAILKMYLESSEAINESQRLELLHKRKDGSYIWSETVVRGLYDSNGVFSHFVGSSRDISERKLSEQQRLQILSEQARVQSMTRFVTAISHDVMTSLSIIKTNAYLLRKSQDEAKRLTKLDNIETQTTRLKEIIEDMLILVRLDSYDSATLQKEKLVLGDILQNLSHAFQTRLKAKEQQLLIEIPAEPVYFRANYECSHLALSKILENAIHYSPIAAAITISVECGDSVLKIHIADNGIGISEQDSVHIFERFYRAEQARPSDQGTGLGLSIVQEVMDLHQGYVELHSTLGKGSRFSLCFPQ